MTESQSGLLLGGVFLGLSIAAPIGPVNIAMIHRGLRDGFAGAFLLGVGSTVADLIYILLAYAGADPLSHQAWARVALFAAGAVVMGWLGLQAIRAALAPTGADSPEGGAVRERGRSAFVSGFCITIVNPMTIAFWLGILSAALAARDRATVGLELMYVASLAAGCLLWTLALASALHFGRRLAGGPALKVISALAGLVLIGFGVQFAWKALQAVS